MFDSMSEFRDHAAASPRTCRPEPNTTVQGLRFVEAWIDAAEEVALLSHVDAMPWLTHWKRRTQHYGVSYGSGSRRGPPERLGDLPAWLIPLAARVHEEGWLERMPDNCVVNEYVPGQGIGMHEDLPAFGASVAIVSLGAPYLMDLRRGDERVEIDLAPRSLLVLGGEARSEWKHGIAARRFDRIGDYKRPRARRVSITFRYLR
jgi:alkylated DNA repair dioxygenase AlkB